MSNGNKLVPSSLEMTMVRDGALVPAGPSSPMLTMPPAAAPPTSGPPGLDEAPSVAALWNALRRRWLLAVSSACLAAVLTVFAVFVFMPPKFVAEGRVLVASKGEVNPFASHREETEFVIYKANLPSLIKSPLNLSSALNQEIKPGRLARDLAIVRDRGGAAVEWLDKAIKTDYNLGPEILKVTLSAERGDEVADLLNAVIQSFLDDVHQKEKARADNVVEELKLNQKNLVSELNVNRRQLGEREKLHKLPNIAEVKNKYEQAVSAEQAVQKEARKIQLDTIQVKTELNSLIDRQKNIDVIPVTYGDLQAFAQNDPRFVPLFAELAKQEKDLQDAERTSANPASVAPYRDKRDRMKERVDERLEELRPELEKNWRSKLAQELKLAELSEARKLSGLENQSKLLEKLHQEARVEVERFQPGIQNVPAEILALRDKVASMERAVGKVDEDITMLRASASKARVSLLQRAAVPQAKDMSRQVKIAGAGGIGMFALLLIGVAYVEFRGRKIGAADDVARGLGMTVLGTIPPMPDAARKPVTQGTSQQDMYWQSRLMESIDAIRTLLLHTARNDSLQVIMITSAVGGEGKTSLASQLAASLARAWKRTLLIDGDLRNPATHKLLNVPVDPGFSEVLRGEVDPAQAIKATSISRLWLLPAGRWDPHAMQALAQDHVRTMLQGLKEQYDFIILDSCPVLPVADTLLLAQHADGVLFSVMRDVSRTPSVWAARQRLQNLGVRTLGAVVIGDQANDGGAAAYKYAQYSAGK